MQMWAVCFVVFFGFAQIFQLIDGSLWLQDFSLPMPVFILAGVLLAIASNSNKRAGLPWRHLVKSAPAPQTRRPAKVAAQPAKQSVAQPVNQPASPPAHQPATASAPAAPQPSPAPSPTPAELPPASEPELPTFMAAPKQTSPISFTIRKPKQK